MTPCTQVLADRKSMAHGPDAVGADNNLRGGPGDSVGIYLTTTVRYDQSRLH